MDEGKKRASTHLCTKRSNAHEGKEGGGIVFQMSCFDKGFPTGRCISDPTCLFSL